MERVRRWFTCAGTVAVPPDQDKMFYMFNMAKIRDKAKYADGRETNLTGDQADRLYNPLPEVLEVGGGMVYAGGVEAQLAGKGPERDRVAIVMYPSRAKFAQMRDSSDFQSTAVHKDASLERSLIMVTVPEESWTFSDKTPIAAADAPHPSSADDPSFTLLQLVKYRDVAQYPDGSSEPKRSGREAMELFWDSLAGILHEAGVRPMLKAEVDGVLVGDGREWDEYRMLKFPSQRAFEEVLAKVESSDFAVHLSAAVEDEYRLQLKDMADRTGNPPTPGNVAQAGPQRSIDASQAPFILNMLDADKDGKISKSEAVDDMKANFAMIDSNGDGGIDLDELTRILEMVAGQ